MEIREPCNKLIQIMKVFSTKLKTKMLTSANREDSNKINKVIKQGKIQTHRIVEIQY